MTAAPKNGHQAAFERWFLRFETERKKRKIAPGRSVPGFPPPPAGPADLDFLINHALRPLSERRIAELCGVHRTTVSRWLDGSAQIPPASFEMLRFHAEGIPPSCGAAWRGFLWAGDSLTCPDGRTTLTAPEIAGAGYQKAYIAALERKIADLERKLIDATQKTDWGAANDAYSDPADIRSKAFSTTQGKQR